MGARFRVRVCGATAAGKLNSRNYLALHGGDIRGGLRGGSSADNAYGGVFSDENKGLRVAGWYFSGEQRFNMAVGYLC